MSKRMFIMWSQHKSREVALELHSFLKSVIQGPKYFISESDIDSGEIWDNVLTGNLEESSFGIACLTRENSDSKWIHFEAGAISKASIGSRIVPYLVDIKESEITGPLTKFQNVDASKEGTKRLILSIRKTLESTTEIVEEDAVVRVFDALWPDYEKRLIAIENADAKLSDKKKSTTEPRDEKEILVEIIHCIRRLERDVHDLPSTNDVGTDSFIVDQITIDKVESLLKENDEAIMQSKRSGISGLDGALKGRGELLQKQIDKRVLSSVEMMDLMKEIKDLKRLIDHAWEKYF